MVCGPAFSTLCTKCFQHFGWKEGIPFVLNGYSLKLKQEYDSNTTYKISIINNQQTYRKVSPLKMQQHHLLAESALSCSKRSLERAVNDATGRERIVNQAENKNGTHNRNVRLMKCIFQPSSTIGVQACVCDHKTSSPQKIKK